MVRCRVTCAGMLSCFFFMLFAPVAHVAHRGVATEAKALSAFSPTASFLHSSHSASPSKQLCMSRNKAIFSDVPTLPSLRRLHSTIVSRRAAGIRIQMVAGDTASVMESVLGYPAPWEYAVSGIFVAIFSMIFTMIPLPLLKNLNTAKNVRSRIIAKAKKKKDSPASAPIGRQQRQKAPWD